MHSLVNVSESHVVAEVGRTICVLRFSQTYTENRQLIESGVPGKAEDD